MKVDRGVHIYSTKDKLVSEEVDTVPVPQWIPVTERLPELKEGTYWVCTDVGGQHECRWTNVNIFWADLKTDWHWNIFDIPQFTKVVAWMPLPEPYKEKT